MTRNLGIGFCFHIVEKLQNHHSMFYFIYIVLCIYIILSIYLNKYILHIYLHVIYINTYVDMGNTVVHIEAFNFKTKC